MGFFVDTPPLSACPRLQNGRAERSSSVTAPAPVYDPAEWILAGENNADQINFGTKSAPQDFDPNSWIGQDSVTVSWSRQFGSSTVCRHRF